MPLSTSSSSEGSRESPPPQREFHFVGSDGPKSRSAIRSYAMRQHLRDKQRKQQQRLETQFHSSGRGAKPLQWRVKSDGTKSSGRPKPAPRPGQDAGPERSRSDPNLRAEVIVPLLNDEDWKTTGVQLAPYSSRPVPEKMLLLPKPQTLLSAARTDPFSALPLSMQDEGFDLMDYYMSSIVAKLFQFGPKGRLLFNPFRDVVFKGCMESSVAFQAAILTLAANQRNRFYNLGDTPQSQFHKAKATRLIEAQIKADHGRATDGVVFAMTGLSHLEDRWGSLNAGQKHMKAVLALVRNQPHQPCPIPGSYKYMHAIRYTLTMPRNTKLRTYNDSRVNKLIDFLSFAHHLMQHHRDLIGPTGKSIRKTMFAPGTTWHRLLLRSAVRIPMPADNYCFSVILRAKNNVRAAAVIYIVIALCQTGRSLSDTEKYLTFVDFTFKNNELDHYPSLELLMWLLLEVDDHAQVGSETRPWVVGDMLEVVKTLDDDMQLRFEETLLAILAMEEPVPSVGDWEKDLKNLSIAL